MKDFLTIKEASFILGLSERRIQMLCKEGNIKGAERLGGIWLLPKESVLLKKENKNENLKLFPEKLYGKNTKVRVNINPVKEAEEKGCTITEYKIAEGITLVFQDINEERLDYGKNSPSLPDDLMAIQHCREGRFEGEYPNGECIYMGPGNLSLNLPACSPSSNSFPLKHYYGFYIAILPKIAEESINSLEKVLGPLKIDFSHFLEKLTNKNKLAFYSYDEKTAKIISDIYPFYENFREEELKLKVLELLQALSRKEIILPKENQYFTFDQVKEIKEIRNFLISNLQSKITLKELSLKYKISLTSMKSCFKGVYGESIGKYLREYKMQAGAEMLSFTDLKIIEIASLLGYENAGKFSEAFKAYFGVSPLKYRKNFCLSGIVSDTKE